VRATQSEEATQATVDATSVHLIGIESAHARLKDDTAELRAALVAKSAAAETATAAAATLASKYRSEAARADTTTRECAQLHAVGGASALVTLYCAFSAFTHANLTINMHLHTVTTAQRGSGVPNRRVERRRRDLN
jgi:hypothetical protein